MIEYLDKIMATIAEVMWSMPLVIFLLGSGIFFTLYSRFTPFLYLRHAIDILMGKYDSADDPGQITHFEALSSALASTGGMGNIAGVAVAIHTGGPGAIFWMWLTAVIGMSTKFFTCTLAVLFRGKDDQGEVQGGVMYYIEEGLGKKYKPLAILFSVSGLFGCITFFQANQLSQIIRDFLYQPAGLFQESAFTGNIITGFIVSGLVGLVIFGGIMRIAKVASKLVPGMVGLYMVAALIILGMNFGEIPEIFFMIFRDAFTGDAVQGGALGSIIVIGVRRGLFSNEAGTGTEAMAHGAAKTKEPVREGLVAMLGPFIDTIIVCSITALLILSSGMWHAGFQARVTGFQDNNNTMVMQVMDLQELGTPSDEWLGFTFKYGQEVFGPAPSAEPELVTILFEVDSVLSDSTVIISESKSSEKDQNRILVSDSMVFYIDHNQHLGIGHTQTRLDDLFQPEGSFLTLEVNGVTLTTLSFKKELGILGQIFLTIAVLTFALSTMFGYSYYGRKCTSHLLGTKWKVIYNWFYLIMIVIASVAPIDIAINFVDSAFAMMVIPTLISTLLLAPKVLQEANRYFSEFQRSHN